jgi:threonine dehydratase
MQASSVVPQTQRSIERDRIAAVERLIRPYVRLTPTITVDAQDFGLDAALLVMKLEFLQHIGSFKLRGAFANLLTRPAPPAGVAAASGGNHGAAVAYAAMRLGIRATIFVPHITSPAKIERIRGYGADLVVAGDRYADALAASEDFVARTGALAIHAYDQTETMIGQGTVGREIEHDAPKIDTLLVAVGGGGLIGGIAAWYAGRIRIVAVEPELAPTLHDALAAGRPIDAPAGGIAADSLAPRRVGELMFPIARRFVERSVLVSDVASARRCCCAAPTPRRAISTARAVKARGSGLVRGVRIPPARRLAWNSTPQRRSRKSNHRGQLHVCKVRRRRDAGTEGEPRDQGQRSGPRRRLLRGDNAPRRCALSQCWGGEN